MPGGVDGEHYRRRANTNFGALDPALLAALDEHRRCLPDLPNRAEAIRRAVQEVASNGASTRKPRARAAEGAGQRTTFENQSLRL